MKNAFAVLLVIVSMSLSGVAAAAEYCDNGECITAAKQEAVERLIAKLNERDLTIRELEEANLDLKVANIQLREELKNAALDSNRLSTLNKKLRAELAVSSKKLVLATKDAAEKAKVKYAEGKKASVSAVRSWLKKADKALSEM